eukprot:s76_g8.t1
MEVFSEAPVKPPPELGRGGEAAAATATKTIADISSNLAAVYLSQGRSRDALEKAELALDLVPKHEKAPGLSWRDTGVKRLAAELERAQTKHAKKSVDFGKAILEAAGEGREYVEKPPEEPLPSFFQEMLMSFMPTKKQFLVLCLLLISAPGHRGFRARLYSDVCGLHGRHDRGGRDERGEGHKEEELMKGSPAGKISRMRREADLLLERLSLQSTLRQEAKHAPLSELLRPGSESTKRPSTGATSLPALSTPMPRGPSRMTDSVDFPISDEDLEELTESKEAEESQMPVAFTRSMMPARITSQAFVSTAPLPSTSASLEQDLVYLEDHGT